ncbi:hypothetical protein, partial [Streptomyces caniscabiei]|uniref:hypothetical protein n=1 Tax=Streptomyces caniscabiei TaxID=2746961 RepID=UPI001C4FEB3F
DVYKRQAQKPRPRLTRDGRGPRRRRLVSTREYLLGLTDHLGYEKHDAAGRGGSRPTGAGPGPC